MRPFGAIVEGDGEVMALPTLVTRVLTEKYGRFDWFFPKPPFRIDRGRFTPRFDDFSRALKLLAPQCDGVLVILDSDDDDPAILRSELEERAVIEVGHVKVRAAPAVREYESWFLSSIPEMAGKLALPTDATYSHDPEMVRGAKGAFKDLLTTRIYKESVDQKKYSAILDIAAAESRSASFAQFTQLIGELTAP